jgi:5-formyltetrahydrofolate cyclo-ligase
VTDTDVDRAKQAARENVWNLLEREAVVPHGVYGHIPDFVGADQAAARLAELHPWKTAAVIKSNPDKAQLPVRVRAVQEGKLLYMAVPKLATPKPFYLLDPATLTVPVADAATSSGAANNAPSVAVDEMRPVDVVVCGSVAVNRNGARVGKGAGYSDIEVALLADAGLIGPTTTIATTVHQLQVVDENLPETAHDFSVDLIVTPEEVIECQPPRRPRGIVIEHLTREKITAIPALWRLTELK